jgi:hypothetical protein
VHGATDPSFVRKTFFIRCAVALGLLGVLFGAAASGAGASPLGHVFPAIDTNASTADYSGTPHHDNYVILQAWETQRLHELKAANPAIKVLVYKDLAFSGPSSGSGSASGVSAGEAQSSWFLKNTSGQKFTSESYDWLWAMDVGSAEYQRKWAENVIGEVETQGWDGVFMDDANASMKYAYEPSKVAKYPNDAAYSAAMESALAYIGPAIQAHGKLAIANFAQWVEAPQTYDHWLNYVNGALDEMFVKWGRGAGEGYRDQGQWETQVEEAEYAASKGKAFLAFTQGAAGETGAARYGYASVLLGGDANASYAFTPNYTSETWIPEYEYEIGNPTSANTAEAGGVHRRQFEDGLVLVNPTDSAQTVSFGGTYSGSGLSSATGATMAPHSALVLTGTSAPETPAATPPVSTPPVTAPPVTAPKPLGVIVTVGDAEVGLQWTPPAGSGATVFAVVKDQHEVAKTHARHQRVKGIGVKKSNRLQVVAYNGRGQVVAKSRTFAVRSAKAGQRRSASKRSYRVS